MMPEINIKGDRHHHRGTDNQHQEEGKRDKKTTGELEEMIEDIDPMTIITMMKEEDPMMTITMMKRYNHHHVLGVTNDIEMAKNIIIKEDGTVTYIQIHQKDKLYKSQYQ